MSNRLAEALSPYLQQHADNPVDWLPWGEEALARAKREDKPILLSVGYSACHWCHVMAHESFENDAIAALMNAHFINIKVDREERPDLDKIYQLAVQLMTRRAGGWPLTVFLTPTLRPFYGGTYFPPEERHGMPGFPAVLEAVARTFSQERPQADQMGEQVLEAIGTVTATSGAPEAQLGSHGVLSIGDGLLETAARQLLMQFDSRYGGFGHAPKFPNAMALRLLLQRHARSGAPECLSAVQHGLDAMIDGGIYDQLGGGFHRYATDARWRVPHFEKMLYDNALLTRLLVDAWRVTGESRYRATIEETLGYIEREMTSPEGGFYSSQDADSEGREGAFFVWTPAQLTAVLSETDARAAALFFGVDEEGNFEGRTTVLHRTRSVEALAQQLGQSLEETQTQLHRVRRELLHARAARPRPFRDEKIIAAWNGWMISAVAAAAEAFGERGWQSLAERALSLVQERLWDGTRLLRVYKDGRAQTVAFLGDYAALANAAIDVYQLNGDSDVLRFARALADQAVARFWSDERGVFLFAERGGDQLVSTEDLFDNATPSATADIANALLRLSSLVEDGGYHAHMERVAARVLPLVRENALAHAELVSVLDIAQRGVTKVMLVAEAGASTPLVGAVRGVYSPGRLLQMVDTASSDAPPEALALAADRSGLPAALICRGQTCGLPIREPAALRLDLAPRAQPR